MGERYHSYWEGEEHIHCLVVLLKLESVKKSNTQHHRNLHLEDIEKNVYGPVRKEIHTRNDLNMFQILLSFEHDISHNRRRQDTETNSKHEEE